MPPPPEHTRTPMGALHTLVLKLFSAEEFRRWLRHGPDADIVPELPGEAAADAAVVDRALAALDRRGRIDADFFARMTAERDRQREAIAAVAALWVKPSGSPRAARAAQRTDAIADRVAERWMQAQSGAPVDPPAGEPASPRSRAARVDAAATPRTGSRPRGGPSGAGHSAPWTSSNATASSTPREVVLASWIHVSDLHFGHGAVGHQWNQRRVLGELLADARALATDDAVPRPDFIFVTGDIAFSGGARTPATGGSEYQLAADWFAELQLALEVPRERVLLVPGNHDVDRGADADVRRMLQLARSGAETIDEILHEPRDLGRLRGRMARYLAFAGGFGPVAGDRQSDGLWWRSRVELEEGVSLRLCGLNTALLAADEHDQGKLRVGERQLAELFNPAPGDLELTVVLGHHPATGRWLADEKEVRGQLDRHGAIHLFGHLHEAESEQTKHGWGGGCLRIAAGAAHAEAGPGDAPPIAHGYNFGALVVLASGDLVVRIWPRRWSGTAPRFVVDVDNSGDRRDYAEHRLPDRYRIQRPAPRPGLHPGDVLGDRYRLVADVGQGGVGQVWRAIDLQSGDTVAVKVLNPDGTKPDPGRRAGFFRGAATMAGLDHPSIARVRDPGPDPENTCGPHDFYVMDFIDAPNLSAAFKQRPSSDKETIEILVAIGEGVAAAHRLAQRKPRLSSRRAGRPTAAPRPRRAPGCGRGPRGRATPAGGP